MKLPLQDKQFIEHHLALAEVTWCSNFKLK